MKRTKVISAAIFILLIIGFGTYTFINKDKLFQSKVEITYADGCVETFINNEMVTPVCMYGRKLEENAKSSWQKPGEALGWKLKDFQMPNDTKP